MIINPPRQATDYFHVKLGIITINPHMTLILANLKSPKVAFKCRSSIMYRVTPQQPTEVTLWLPVPLDDPPRGNTPFGQDPM